MSVSVTRMACRAVALLTVGVTAALLLAGAVIAWAAGLYMALTETLGPVVAVLLASGVPLLIGISALLAMPLFTQSQSEPYRGADAEALLSSLGSLAGSQLQTLVGAHPRKTAMASLLAGFAVGASPDLRRTLLKLLKP